jgi:hypothetical protein
MNIFLIFSSVGKIRILPFLDSFRLESQSCRALPIVFMPIGMLWPRIGLTHYNSLQNTYKKRKNKKTEPNFV